MDATQFLLNQNDWVPNNQHLPVRLYRTVEAGDCEEIARAFEERFARHGWPPRWRDTVFDYHHYHSTAHEALGVAAGSATLMLGGPGARSVNLQSGDALILPVGTGHCRIDGSEDFLVVGAYPKGQDWDICRNPPTKKARERIETMPAPEQDPVMGGPFGIQK